MYVLLKYSYINRADKHHHHELFNVTNRWQINIYINNIVFICSASTAVVSTVVVVVVVFFW